MKKVTITRTDFTDKSTSGYLSFVKKDGYAYTCRTLELPDKKNKPKISCIPKGTYDVKYTLSPSFKKHTYEIQNVPTRAGIRIHSGNFTRQILGCILLGKIIVDIDKDGVVDITESRKTIDEFELLMNYESFTLTII